jgi:hypothetical protein
MIPRVFSGVIIVLAVRPGLNRATVPFAVLFDAVVVAYLCFTQDLSNDYWIAIQACCDRDGVHCQIMGKDLYGVDGKRELCLIGVGQDGEV